MDFKAVLVCQSEYLDQPDRIPLEPAIGGKGEPPAVEHKAIELARRTAESCQRKAPPLGRKAVVEMGEEHTGQIAHLFCNQEIMLHEPLDCRTARPICIVHPRRNLSLDVESQPFLRAPGQRVEMAAHGPEEIFRLLKLAQLSLGQKPAIDQIGNTLDAVDIFSDPEQRVKVAQAALAFLQVGLDHIAAVAHSLVPCFAFGEFLGHEAACGARDHVGIEARRGLVVE